MTNCNAYKHARRTDENIYVFHQSFLLTTKIVGQTKNKILNS